MTFNVITGYNVNKLMCRKAWLTGKMHPRRPAMDTCDWIKFPVVNMNPFPLNSAVMRGFESHTLIHDPTGVTHTCLMVNVITRLNILQQLHCCEDNKPFTEA